MVNKILNNKKIIQPLFIVIWLLIWQCISLVVKNPLFLPGPLTTLLAFVNMLPDSLFWKSIVSSLLRIIIGFLFAYLAGTFLGYISYKYSFVKAFLAPFVSFLKSVPVASIVVLLLIWAGATNLSFFVSFMVIFPGIYASSVEGYCSTDKKLIQMASLYNFSKRDMRNYVYAETYFSHIKSSLKSLVGMGFKSGVAAEIIGLPTSSIGERLYIDKVYFNTAGVFAWTIVIILLSVMCEKIFIGIVDLRFKMRTVAGPVKRKLSNASVFSYTDVSFAYEKKNVIEDFSYEFKTNDLYIITGNSGRGKTTLLHIIAGILNCDSKHVSSVLFQEDRLIESASSLDNILLATGTDNKALIVEYLEKSIGKEYVNKSVSSLSGGMKRRVALLRALFADSDLLILDEPFTGLDDDNRRNMFSIIKEMSKNRCVIMSLHNLDDIETKSENIIRLGE